MQFRIALIVALVFGLAAAVLNVVVVGGRLNKVVSERNDWQAKFTQADSALTQTRAELETTTQKLKSTETELTSAKSERDKAVAEAQAQRENAAKLTEQIKAVRQELAEAQNKLAAWDATGVQPDQIRALQAQIRTLENTKAELTQQLEHLGYQYYKATNELAIYKTSDYAPPVPPNVTGRVLVVDPKWEFVVLDVGLDQGVVEHSQLLISRQGKLVAKVKVQSVEKDRCIANILPGWKLTDVYEGDLVTP